MMIFELYTEVSPLPGCELISDCNGAFVYIYVPCVSLESAIEKCKNLIFQDKLDFQSFDYVRKVKLDEWESENNENCPTLSELGSAIEDNHHLYSIFYSFDSHYEH